MMSAECVAALRDQRLTGTSRALPGLREAMAACRAGDTLVVTRLDRLARSSLTLATSSTSSPPAAFAQCRRLRPRLEGPDRSAAVHLPVDRRPSFDLARARNREGTPVAKARGCLRESNQRSSPPGRRLVPLLNERHPDTTAELADLFKVGRSTVCRAIKRGGVEDLSGVS